MKNFSHYDKALAQMSQPKPDFQKAAALLLKALNQKDYRAAYALGTWYLHGRYYSRNLGKAVKLLKLASDNDVAAAAYDLAVCYETGVGASKNLARALRLYLKAALLGDSQSVYAVGRCYYYGFGVKRDTKVANVWLDHAKRLKAKQRKSASPST